MLKLKCKVYKSHSISLSFIKHFYFPTWWALGVINIYMSEFTIQQDRNIYIFFLPEYKKQAMCTCFYEPERRTFLQ